MKVNAKKIAGIGLMTAIVVVLQLIGSAIRFGTFSISLVLIPIVIGTALARERGSAWYSAQLFLCSLTRHCF